MERYVYFLPWPPSVNQLYRSPHRTLLSRHGRLWKQAASYAIFEQKRPESIIDTPVSVEIKLRPPHRRRFDLDNYAKVVLDALTDAGVIVDDNSRVVRQLTLSVSEAELPHEGGVLVEVAHA